MKPKGILLTGLRLIAILKILYNSPSNKNEIKQILKDEYNIEISNETLKLDINTLCKQGFQISRGNKSNGFKYILNKNFSLFKFNHKESGIFLLIKNIAMETLDFKEILYLREFYKKIINLFDESLKDEILDFKYFNNLDVEILKKAKHAIDTKSKVSIIYNSPTKGNCAYSLYITKFVYRNEKLYINCISTQTNKTVTFRTDKIKSIDIEKENVDFEFSSNKKRYLYTIKKEFYLNYPLKNFEHVVSFNDESVEIEAYIDNKFFVIQRILFLGKNCIKIKDDEIKNEVIDSLIHTKESYI